MVKGSEAPVYGTLQSSFSSVFCFVRTDFYFFRRRIRNRTRQNALKNIFLGTVRRGLSDYRDLQIESVWGQEGTALW